VASVIRRESNQPKARPDARAQAPIDLATFVRALGVPDLPPRTSAFDPGYDPATVESHLVQSGRLITRLKLSMACWLIADQSATEAKIARARSLGVPLVSGGGPFEIARARGRLDEFLELCANMGIDRIEAGEGFTTPVDDPGDLVRRAASYGLEVQAELGEKQGGAFDQLTVAQVIDRGARWLDAGAKQIVVEARESAQGVGLFDDRMAFNASAADALAAAWGLDKTVFEAPTKRSQFDLMSHFGNEVSLGNVRLEEILRVEIYRRGLHADSFAQHLAERPDAEL
jgi:phosphosulfolactate synthase